MGIYGNKLENTGKNIYIDVTGYSAHFFQKVSAYVCICLSFSSI